MRPDHTHPARRPLRARPIVITAAGILAVAAGGWWFLWPHTLYARLAATAPERSIAPRTSLPVRYRACQVAAADSLVPGAACAQSPAQAHEGDEFEELAADVARVLANGPNEDALLTQAEMELRAWPGHPVRPADAISYLDSALRITHDDSARVMANLAAAYMVRAGQSQLPEDLMVSLVWSDFALELEPRNLVALYNRALALEALLADISAAEAWQRYLEADRKKGLTAYLRMRRGRSWRREAEQRLRALEARAPAPIPGDDAADGSWQDFASRNPQRARKWAWETVLLNWAAAVEAGDTARAASSLHTAEVIGRALMQHPGGDAAVYDHVARIRDLMRRGEDLHGIARGHRFEREIVQARKNFDNERVDSLLRSRHADSLTVAQRAWLSLRGAAALSDQERWEAARDTLDQLERTLDLTRYPAAKGYLLWLRGTILAKHGRESAAATVAWRAADTLYARVGEIESRSWVQGLVADVQADIGNMEAGTEWARRAAQSARPLGMTVARHNAMRMAAITAHSLGLDRAMRDLADEDVKVAEAFGDPAYIDEALLNRAALAALAGKTPAALRDMARVTPPAAIASPQVRSFLERSRAYARAAVLRDEHPDSVAATVSALVTDLSAFWRTRGLGLRAYAAATLGDTARARQDLDSVFVTLARGRGESGGAVLRQGSQDVRPALHRLVSFLAERGDTVGSLRVLERGTAALSSIRVGDAELPRAVPRGRVVIRPLLLDSTLFVWTMRDGEVELVRTRVSRDSLKAAIEALESSLPHGWDVDRERAYLYRELVAPVEHRLGGEGDHVVLVRDSELGRIPFAALPDARGRLLVEDHPVWTVVSVAAAAAPADTTPLATAAFFAPVFDASLNPALDPLDSAGAEVRNAVRALGARRVSAPETPDGFLDALARVQLVHFAGHAVVDEFRPERSYLVFAPGKGKPAGHLTASELGAVPMRQVRLVVLSACHTLGGDASAQGFTGLSGALLDAGARGVVGSLWRVHDASTSRLMDEFYRSYAQSHDPAFALWNAQRAMLHSADPKLNTPATWAAFQYVGR